MRIKGLENIVYHDTEWTGMFSKKKTEDVIAFKYMKGSAKKGINGLLCQGRVAMDLNFSKENSDKMLVIFP